jgi:flavin reductase (DIM6/NTAB) family NADH-FMN oxidoreductase RutF
MTTGPRVTRRISRSPAPRSLHWCVLNLPSPDQADAVDRLALLTGSPQMTPHKVEKRYRYEPDKFGAARLTPRAADLVAAPLVAECPIQLECELVSAAPFDHGNSTAHTVRVVRAHVDEELIVPGTQHIDPDRWDPLIMKFCEFYGGGVQVRPSRLAEAWQIPQTAHAH